MPPAPALRVVLVSAHPDDVALSVGGLLHRFERVSIVLVTCFTVSCTTSIEDASETTGLRAAEDEAYAHHLRARLIRFRFPDTSIRTRRGTSSTSPEHEAQLQAELCHELGTAIEGIDADAVFVPLAIGAHEDHVHCRQAVARVSPDSKLVFYEDLPYAQMEGGSDRVEEAVRGQFPHLCANFVSLTPADMTAKMRGLDFYGSQIHPLWRRDVEQYAMNVGGGRHAERVWLSPCSSFRDYWE